MLKRYCGMGGRPGSSLYAIPVIKNLIACSSVHPGRPAILGVLSAQTGIGTIGLNVSVAPFNNFPGMGSPFSLVGVCQSPHLLTPSTRYFPRASFTDRFEDEDEEGNATVITKIAKTVKPAAQTPSFM